MQQIRRPCKIASVKIAISDRGDIVHLAGLHSLSPALVDGAPRLVSGPDPARCGWEPFFAAMEGRRLALAYDPEAPTSAVLVAAREAKPFRRAHPGFAAALSHSGRFLRALFP